MIMEGANVSAHSCRLRAGDLIAGKYRLDAVLGEGGMGKVWRARSLALDTDVAIKVLQGERIEAQAAARLQREARATAKLGHPSIVRVLDFGVSAAGEPFLVMELLEGESLADWLETKGKLTAADAVRILLPIADALAVAHEHGIVHRDVKPENILLTLDREGALLPKIVDFGIAKIVDEAALTLTQAGMVIGSIDYMSPEQAEGDSDVDGRSDVWSFSIVLYELVTGRRPFDRTTMSSSIEALSARGPTPIHTLACGDEKLWKIVKRGLERDREKRWPSMRALGAALAHWAERRESSAAPARTKTPTFHGRSAPLPLLVGLASLGALASALAFAAPRIEGKKSHAQAMLVEAMAAPPVVVTPAASETSDDAQPAIPEETEPLPSTPRRAAPVRAAAREPVRHSGRATHGSILTRMPLPTTPDY